MTILFCFLELFAVVGGRCMVLVGCYWSLLKSPVNALGMKYSTIGFNGLSSKTWCWGNTTRGIYFSLLPLEEVNKIGGKEWWNPFAVTSRGIICSAGDTPSIWLVVLGDKNSLENGVSIGLFKVEANSSNYPEINGEFLNLINSSAVFSNLYLSCLMSFNGTLFIFLKNSKLVCSLVFGGD